MVVKTVSLLNYCQRVLFVSFDQSILLRKSSDLCACFLAEEFCIGCTNGDDSGAVLIAFCVVPAAFRSYYNSF